MPMTSDNDIRPLRRVGDGVWDSRDQAWTFMRHRSDPHPQRWYAFNNTSAAAYPEIPENEGLGHVSLCEVVDWAERQERCS